MAAGLRALLQQLFEAVAHLHAKGLLHGDLKMLNVVRFAVDNRLRLIDLDAAVRIGEPLGHKRSTGYAAPELVRLGEGGLLPHAHPSFDAWSLGVVLHLLTTGETLFHLNAVTDNVKPGGPEEARLKAWTGVGDDALRDVFSGAPQLEDYVRENARDLVRWCLHPDPAQRPQSMVRVLNHAFLKEGGLRRARGAEYVSIWYPDLRISDVLLGEGAGGSVFLTTYHGHRVAVKKVRKGQEDEALAEAKITQLLHEPEQHPCVLMMYG